MKWFNNLKISKKIIFVCLLLIILMTSIALLGIRSSSDTSKAFNVFYNERFMPVRQLNGVIDILQDMRYNMTQQQKNAEKGRWDEVARLKNEASAMAEKYKKLRDAYFATSISGEEKALVDTWNAHMVAGVQVRTKLNNAYSEKNIKESVEYLDQWLTIFPKMQLEINKLIDFRDRAAVELKNKELDNGKMTIMISAIILGISIILAIFLTIIMTKSITTPVNKSLECVKKLERGDFTERIDFSQNDELGILVKSVNVTAAGLEKNISTIVTSTANLVQAVQQISAGNQNLAQRTTEQASSLEEISSVIEETTAAINQNAENTQEANNIAQNTTLIGSKGGSIVNDAVLAINDISESSKKIGEIINLINEIAFQTNLLALNAAVEAARAGDHGRGFAVVAGEVRNLAQRSGNASKEISILIKDMIVKVEKGTALSNQSGQALKEITESINRLSKFLAEIAVASDEQRNGMNQIASAITDMDSMTQQNAGLVEETASASTEMESQATALLALMKRFKIGI